MLEEISILRPKHIALQTQLGDFDQKPCSNKLNYGAKESFQPFAKKLGKMTWLKPRFKLA